MNRRGFLGMWGAAIAGATLDPEELLWVPGKKLISIPKPAVVLAQHFEIGDIITIAGRYAINPRTFEYESGLQRFVVTGVTESGDGLNVFPTLNAIIAPQDIVRHNRIDPSDPAQYTRIAP